LKHCKDHSKVRSTYPLYLWIDVLYSGLGEGGGGSDGAENIQTFGELPVS